MKIYKHLSYLFLVQGGLFMCSESYAKSIEFPAAAYKTFATGGSADSLDPKIAYPKIEEIGLQHLEIKKKYDGYAWVSANLLATKVNIPFGWESLGGFDPFDKIYFSPEPMKKSVGRQPFPYIAIKVLDSMLLGTKDFYGVMKEVDLMVKGNADKDPAFKNTTTFANPDKKVFFQETKGIKHVSGNKASALHIYIQDPTPDSALWVDLQTYVAADKFEAYKGLLGLMYKDIQIDWKELKRVIESTK